MSRLGGALIAGLIAMGAGLPSAQAGTGARQTADEADLLARARAERLLVAPDASAVDPADRIRDQAIDAEVGRRLEEAERQAELDAISVRLGQRGRVWGSDDAASPERAGVMPPQRQSPGQPQMAPRFGGQAQAEIYGAYGAPTGALAAAELGPGISTRATILLVMTPGDRGIRRYNPSADPILCVGETCWISRGLTQDARSTRRAKAFGPINTLGERAGACNDSTRCVFRNVDLGNSGAIVQPVDLRLMRHDRREPMRIEIDQSCQVVGRAIQCGAPQSGADYVMWVVPEAVAAAAGSDALASFTQHGRLVPDRRVAGNR